MIFISKNNPKRNGNILYLTLFFPFDKFIDSGRYPTDEYGHTPHSRSRHSRIAVITEKDLHFVLQESDDIIDVSSSETYGIKKVSGGSKSIQLRFCKCLKLDITHIKI